MNTGHPKHRIRAMQLALTTCLVTVASQPTISAEMETVRDFPQRIFIGGSIGASTLKPDTRNTGFHQDDDSSTGGTLVLGLDINKHLSVEGFYSTLGEAGIASDSSGDHVGEIDYGYGGISAIGYLFNSRGSNDYPGYSDDEGFYRREGLSFFTRIGAGKLYTSSSSITHRQRKDWDLHLGAGFEYGWSNGFAARLEFLSFDEDAKLLSIGLIKRFGRSHTPRSNTTKPSAPPVAAATVTPPLSPEPPAAPAPHAVVTLPTIRFEFNQHDLTPAATEKLDGIASVLRKDEAIKLRVIGHTDSMGSEQYNQLLGKQRADTTAEYLIRHGIEARRLKTLSEGETRPVADNATAEGRRLNRRVEFETEGRQ